MIFLLVPFLSSFLLLLLSKSLSAHPLPSWATDMRLLSSLLLRDLILQLLCFLHDCTLAGASFAGRIRSPKMPSPKRKLQSRPDSGAVESRDPSILDLPELALELVLGKLPPPALRSMAAVCAELRDRCRSDRLWERHVGEKWGRVIGPAARREWQLQLASNSAQAKAGGGNIGGGGGGSGRSRRWIAALSCVWPLSWIKSGADRSSSGGGGGGGGGSKPRRSSPTLPDDSLMAWYMSMESGKFWFPAQVYNREHGHVGFILSCYDAEVSYDCRTDTFHARYPPHGRRTIVVEEGVQWDRLRPPPVDTPAHDLHVSDCLNDLRPGDHIEIQWRRNKEFPYGWWYGVVGHLESCDGNEHFCRCHLSDTVALEFNHYTPGSRWRRASVNRKDHREEGNETDGFYGGIRKLRCKAEISKWRQLWPTDVLE